MSNYYNQIRIYSLQVILKRILSDIYEDTYLRSTLAFKGGTCLYFFYNLDLFSTYLDFNLILKDNSFQSEKLKEILKKYISIDDYREKYYTWFYRGSYEKGLQRMKVEINKRDYPDRYINFDFYGLTVKTMAPECMFAHKLCAITDRRKLQNIDLYDAYFMFKNNFEVNEEIIKLRTGKDIPEYYKFLIDYIQTNAKK